MPNSGVHKLVNYVIRTENKAYAQQDSTISLPAVPFHHITKNDFTGRIGLAENKVNNTCKGYQTFGISETAREGFHSTVPESDILFAGEIPAESFRPSFPDESQYGSSLFGDSALDHAPLCAGEIRAELIFGDDGVETDLLQASIIDLTDTCIAIPNQLEAARTSDSPTAGFSAGPCANGDESFMSADELASKSPKYWILTAKPGVHNKPAMGAIEKKNTNNPACKASKGDNQKMKRGHGLRKGGERTGQPSFESWDMIDLVGNNLEDDAQDEI